MPESASPGFDSGCIVKVVSKHVGVMRVFTVSTHLQCRKSALSALRVLPPPKNNVNPCGS
jgi:hypothetical protein